MADNKVDYVAAEGLEEGASQVSQPAKQSILDPVEGLYDGSDHHDSIDAPEEDDSQLLIDGMTDLEDVVSCQVEESGSEESDSSDEDADEADELDISMEICLHDDPTGRLDNEVERHEAVVGTNISQEAMAEASRTALFRRYSRMTPAAMEEQEKSLHDESQAEVASVLNFSVFRPDAITHKCESLICADQIRWRDARITELQAALDHMTEAMAIQQRDMASQRVFLSRQAEQLTRLSNILHEDRVALYVERERFQKAVASSPPIAAVASKLKPAAGKIKSPVKKLLMAAGRRSSFANTEPTLSVTSALQPPSASRAGSSSRLRHNPLVTTGSNTLVHRGSSLSTLELGESSARGVIAITPPKNDVVRAAPPRSGDAVMTDVTLSPPKSTVDSNSSPRLTNASENGALLPDLDTSKRLDRVDSYSDLTAEQKKQSLGDRLRSLRWGRS